MKGKVIVLVSVLALVGVAGVAWLEAQHGFSAREQPSAVEAMAARAMRAISMPASAMKMTSPKPIDEAALSDALMHWADHCAICHASNGSGDTPIGRGLYPKPPDMRTDITQAKTDGELFFIIENGIRLTGMPAWGTEKRHGDESWALVAFIRQLPKLKKEQLEQVEAMKPKSPHEAMEEKDEDEFLRGGSTNPETKP
jgi:mono/diheme cytochrome c family protein